MQDLNKKQLGRALFHHLLAGIYRTSASIYFIKKLIFMPNKQVNIYVKREDVEKILKDNRITHLHLHGHIEFDKDDENAWNIMAAGHSSDPTATRLALNTCPHPCS